jgi:FG-GAP-like repeat
MALETPYDYNGDGFSDVRWFNSGTAEELIWNIQNNQFNSQQVVNRSVLQEGVFLIPFSPQAGDFNGDGTTDLFVWDGANTDVWLYQNDQVASIIPGPDALAGAGWRPLTAADYDGDGDSDVFWHNVNTDANLIWRFEDGEFVSQTNLPATLPQWQLSPLGSGDFNGDGTYDVLWHNVATNDNVIWLLNDAQFVSQTTLPDTVPAWTLFGTGDFNGDNTSDLLWHNVVTNDNVVWQINDGQFVMQSNLPDTLPAWRPEIGNFDADATSEIFWNNPASDTNVIWEIDNLNFVFQVDQPAALTPPWVAEHPTFLMNV